MKSHIEKTLPLTNMLNKKNTNTIKYQQTQGAWDSHDFRHKDATRFHPYPSYVQNKKSTERYITNIFAHLSFRFQKNNFKRYTTEVSSDWKTMILSYVVGFRLTFQGANSLLNFGGVGCRTPGLFILEHLRTRKFPFSAEFGSLRKGFQKVWRTRCPW